jgi:peptidoglycan/LPS O-acetylase OafA/YrhL
VSMGGHRGTARGPAAGAPVRYYPIDALRGVAALLVLSFHLFRNSPQHAVLAEMFPAPSRPCSTTHAAASASSS